MNSEYGFGGRAGGRSRSTQAQDGIDAPTGHHTFAGMNVVKSGVKRKTDNNELKDVDSSKRAKTTEKKLIKNDALRAAISALEQQCRNSGKRRRHNLRKKIRSLEHQSRESQQLSSTTQIQAGTSRASLVVTGSNLQAAGPHMSTEELKLLTDTVINLSADKTRLENQLSTQASTLQFKDNLLSIKDAKLKANTDELQAKESELQTCQAQLTALQNDRHLIQQQNLDKITLEQDLKDLKELHAQTLKTSTQQAHKLEAEKSKTKALVSDYASNTKKIKDQAFNNRVMLQASHQKALKAVQKDLDKCGKKLKSQEGVGAVWKERAKGMYNAYRDVHAKNEKLVKRLGAVLEAGSLDSEGLSAKSRKVLEGLGSCPVEELEAFWEG